MFSCLQIYWEIWDSRDHTVCSSATNLLGNSSSFSLFFNLSNSLKLRLLEDRIEKCCDHKISAKSLIIAFQILEYELGEALHHARGFWLMGSMWVQREDSIRLCPGQNLPMNWMSTDDNLMNLPWTWNQTGVVHETYILNNFLIIIIFACLIYLAVLGPSCGMWDLSCGMWDLVPQSGTGPGPPALGVQSLSPWTTRKDPLFWNSGEHLRLEELSH